MAIDFMVMPLSRYMAGDFVTPAMRIAWNAGVPYTLVGPAGTRELPPDVPFGGAEAAGTRERILETVLGDLRDLPSEISNHLWDERSAAEPRFHRVDPASYAALLDCVAAGAALRSLLTFWKAPPPAHCASAMLLPCNFTRPVAMVSPYQWTLGSTMQAMAELAAAKLSAGAMSAAAVLQAALQDSADAGLPMIVDS